MIVDFTKSDYFQILAFSPENDNVTAIFSNYVNKLFSEGFARTEFYEVYKFYADNQDRLLEAQGSNRKHQSWWRGYLDHLTQMLFLLEFNISMGLINEHYRSYLAVAILLHDIEKLFRDTPNFDKYETIYDLIGEKSHYRFSDNLEYSPSVVECLIHDIRYAHGEGKEHNPVTRVMRPTGAWLHVFDILSSRVYYDKTYIEMLKIWKHNYEAEGLLS